MAASILEQLQTALGGTYTIERELGRGGMATVYLARDTKHQRPVALKVRARVAYDEQVKANPRDGQRLAFRALSAAYEERCAEAIADGKRSTTFSIDKRIAPYVQHQLARIYLLCGQKDKAMDVLEPLMRDQYYLTPAWLKIDPMLAGLRGNARFDKLVAGA